MNEFCRWKINKEHTFRIKSKYTAVRWKVNCMSLLLCWLILFTWLWGHCVEWMLHVSLDLFVDNPIKAKPSTDPAVFHLLQLLQFQQSDNFVVSSEFAGGLPVCHMRICMDVFRDLALISVIKDAHAPKTSSYAIKERVVTAPAILLFYSKCWLLGHNNYSIQLTP